MSQDNKEFTLEDILAEERAKREVEAAQQAARKDLAQERQPRQPGARPPQRPAGQPAPRPAAPQQAQPPKQQPQAAQPQPQGQQPAKPRQEAQADLNAYATGTVELPLREEDRREVVEEASGKKDKKEKKKKRRGLFGRKKRVPDFDENEDDLYYGIQLKPIDEYRMGYDPAGELTSEEETYKALFDDSKKAIDDEVEQNFQRLQKERRRRVAEAVQTAGVDEEQIADEFGVVAPMPVTSFAADPYARQHGIGVEGSKQVSDLQKAMLESSDHQTMEIKLNVLNDTVELQRVGQQAPVSDEAINRVLESDAPLEPVEQLPPQEAPAEIPAPVETPAPAEAPQPVEELPPQEEPAVEEPIRLYQPKEQPQEAAPAREQAEPSQPVEQQLSFEDLASQAPAAPEESTPQAPVEEPDPAEAPMAQQAPVPEAPAPAAPVVEAPTQAMPVPQVPAAPAPAQPPVEEKTVVLNRPVTEPPQVASIYQYRPRSVPTHIIHAEVLQSALLSESEELRQAAERQERKNAPKRRVRNKKLENPAPEEPPIPDADTGESIDDYTGPEDAKSISHELRGEMRELTLRMMITGVCTVLLALVNVIFGAQFGGVADPGSLPVVYVVLTLVFLAVVVGICYRTIANGLKALFSFNANSDSAAAVAAVAVTIQAVAAAFFQDDLINGELHLYAVILAATLFLNAAGKLTMIRRIHSNFRFVTSREEKYSVRLFEDHNTALKMAKDCVSESPVIAYQCRAGFLKRFLELSYKPDPSESASQLMAPIGLIASLVLCIASLLITKSVPTAVSALAAACCASVAVSNMLSVNLPISRLCRTARRAGAMVVGYEGVEQLGNVNAVMVDAEDLFPRGTVVLNGIRTFGGRAAAEDAVMAASALMKEVGGPLSGVFDQVISENEDALPQVQDFSYEDGGGIVGKVDGKTILIGDRSLLINHRLQVPPREEEAQYASGNQQVVYIGVDSEVAALLVLTYTADRRRKNELQRLEDSGISIIVRTTDPNVTPQLVNRLFGIDAASVGVLDNRLGDEYRKLVKSQIPRADALVATKGRMESMMSVISACVEEKRTISLVVAIQNAAMVLCFVLVAFLACFGAMGQLSSLVLFLFQLFWLAVTILLPKLRR